MTLPIFFWYSSWTAFADGTCLSSCSLVAAICSADRCPPVAVSVTTCLCPTLTSYCLSIKLPFCAITLIVGKRGVCPNRSKPSPRKTFEGEEGSEAPSSVNRRPIGSVLFPQSLPQ